MKASISWLKEYVPVEMTASDLADRIFELMDNTSKRRAMTDAAQKLIDGQGHQRIYDLIKFLDDGQGIK